MKKYTDQGKVDTGSGFGAGLVLLALVAVAGCSPVEAEQVGRFNSHRIELDDALSHLDAFMTEYNVRTKAEGGVERHYTPENISVVKASAVLPVTTKAQNDLLNYPEDLLYLVNFDGDNGAAVLAADDRLCNNIMCVTEAGSLSASDFIEAANLMNSSTKAAPIDSVDYYTQNDTYDPQVWFTWYFRMITYSL